MTPCSDQVTLSVRGHPVPALGLGTWPLKGEACARAVEDALSIGYRHLDTAQHYENEEDVGRGLRRSGVERGQVFLVTKLFPGHAGPDEARRATYESLRRLGTDYIDLLLLHWLNLEVPFEQTLGAMRRLQEEGAIRHVGLSNVTADWVERAAGHVEVFCNQMEYHPYQRPEALVEQARQRGFLFTAYSPLAKGRVVQDPVLREIGQRHGKSAAQVAIRWVLQKGLSAIPKAGSESHRRANLDVFDFALSEAEMERIDALAG